MAIRQICKCSSFFRKEEFEEYIKEMVKKYNIKTSQYKLFKMMKIIKDILLFDRNKNIDIKPIEKKVEEKLNPKLFPIQISYLCVRYLEKYKPYVCTDVENEGEIFIAQSNYEFHYTLDSENYGIFVYRHSTGKWFAFCLHFGLAFLAKQYDHEGNMWLGMSIDKKNVKPLLFDSKNEIINFLDELYFEEYRGRDNDNVYGKLFALGNYEINHYFNRNKKQVYELVYYLPETNSRKYVRFDTLSQAKYYLNAEENKYRNIKYNNQFKEPANHPFLK